MKPFLALLGLFLLPFAPASAQTVQAPQATAALVCAYNSSPPTITSGNFAYVQCDASGHVISSSSFATVPFTATGGTTSSTLVNRFGHLKNAVDDFGAVADGATDSTAAITAMGTAGAFLIPPTTSPLTNYIKTTTAQNAFPNMFALFGSGRVIDTAGNLRGPIYSVVSTLPTQLGNYGTNQLTAFNADYSHVPLAIETNIIGTALGPTVGSYVLGRQTAAMFIRSFNSAGWNNGTGGGGGGGRSGQPSILVDFANASPGGDMAPLWFNGTATGQKPGATAFGANSAITGPAGQLNAGADGIYMEPFGDLDCVDQGFDAACMSVINLTRTNAAGNLGTVQGGVNVQSVGTVPIDFGFRLAGPAMTGLDLTQMATADQAVLAKPTISAGGANYALNDLVSMAGGTCDQTPTFYVKTLSGSAIATFGIERRGMCSVYPANPATLTTVTGVGSGATATITAVPLVGIAMPTNTAFVWNSTCDNGISGGCFGTTNSSNSYLYYTSALGLTFVDQGRITLEAIKNSVTVMALNLFITQGGRKQAQRRITSGTTDTMDTTANSDDLIIWRSATASPKAQTILACNVTNTGRMVTIKDGQGTAGTNNITITPASGTIEGAATLVMATNKQSVQLQCDGTGTDWIKLN